MKKIKEIIWERYSLLTALVNRHNSITRGRLQNTIFLLQRLYGLDYLYQFDFDHYMPFSSQIESDLFMLKEWGIIETENTLTFIKYNPVFLGRALSKRNCISERYFEILDSFYTDFKDKTDQELDIIAFWLFLLDLGFDKEKAINTIAFWRPKIDSNVICELIIHRHLRCEDIE